jgi:hypothetical protein
MCEQLGQEPDPAKMPLDSSDFPEEVQVAFFIFSLLSDNWDGMSGTYLGKDWTQCTLFFMKLYENIIVSYKSEEAEKKRKAEERKAKSAGGGKQYTHNVRG